MLGARGFPAAYRKRGILANSPLAYLNRLGTSDMELLPGSVTDGYGRHMGLLSLQVVLGRYKGCTGIVAGRYL